MDQSATKHFHAALCHLLKQEGRGAQSRLSGQQNIDRGYLNAIVKGRKPGSEEVRARIAAYFHMTYEEMLSLGRSLLPDPIGYLAGEKTQRIETCEYESGGYIHKSADASATISGRIGKAVEILESDTVYRDVLAGLIDTFHEAINTQKMNHALHNEVSEMKQRIAFLEKKLEESKSQLKKSA